MCGVKPRRSGFTLIELLIVIAIILILIAIALPNFLEAQVRAKVTRAKAEIRTLGIAMESYFIDWKFYPCESEPDLFTRPRNESGLEWLTSPVKYLLTIPEDPFNDSGDLIEYNSYETGGTEVNNIACPWCMATWVIFTRGPDYQENEVSSADPMSNVSGDGLSVDSYSPTNGSKSLGDIFLFGGDGFWVGVRMGRAVKRNYNPASQDVGLPVNRIVYLHRLPPPLE